MQKYILYKIFIMFITFWVIITSVFFIMKALPGSPFDLENEINENIKSELEKKYGLDQPLISQYFKYIKSVIKLDLGVSYKDENLTVTHIIKNAFKYSAVIGFLSMFLAIFLGVILGVYISENNKFFDKVVLFNATFGIAMPNFILAILFVYIFGENYNLIHVGNIYSWKSYLGPIIVLSIYPMSFIIKIVRANMEKILKESYIKVLKTYGVSKKKILFKYALKEVLIPVVTYIAPMVASVIMGSFAIEKIFAIPGLGKVFIDSVINRDYYVTFGLILFYAIFYLLTVFIADICYFILDPRLKLSADINQRSNILDKY